MINATYETVYEYHKKLYSKHWHLLQKEVSHLRKRLPEYPLNTDTDFKYQTDFVTGLCNDVLNHMADKVMRNPANRGVPRPIILENLKQQPEFAQIIYSTTYSYLSMVNFELFHKKTFYIADGLVQNLAFTDLNAPSMIVRPPFNSCLFILTSPIAIEAIQRLMGIDKRIDDQTLNVYIHYFPSTTTPGAMTLVFQCWGLKQNGEGIASYVSRQLLLRNDWDITQSLKTDWSKIRSPEDELKFTEEEQTWLNWVEGGRPEQHSGEPFLFDDNLLLFKILINAILYITSKNPDLIHTPSPRKQLLEGKKGREKRLAEVDAKKLSPLDIEVAGSSFKSILIKRSSNSSDEETSSDEVVLTIPQIVKGKRFLVHGHWRNAHQRHLGYNEDGTPKITSVQSSYIRPYFKGDDLAELLERDYRVE